MPQPPIAKRVPFVVPSPHGSRPDPYYWMRDDERKDPEMLAYLQAEADYKEAALEHLKPLEDKLFNEIVGRIKKDDSSVPYKKRGYYYYARYEAGGEYPIYARKRESLEAAEEILLNVNEMAQGHDYFHVGQMSVSPDNQLLAFAEDQVGRRAYTVKIKNLRTGELLTDTLPGNSASLAWAGDNQTIFYIEKDPKTLLGRRVKRHVLGTSSTEDVLVHEEMDESFYMGLTTTSDDAFVLIHLSSTVSDEVRYLPATEPMSEFQVLIPRRRNHEYNADHIGTRWVIRTNQKAINFRIVEADDDAASDEASWRELVPAREDAFVHGFDLFNDYLAISERVEGIKQVRVLRWDKSAEFTVQSDESASVSNLSVNAEPASKWLRYTYSSLVTPSTTYEIDMETQERRLLKQEEVLGGFDPRRYRVERIWAKARDGVRVPVSLLMPADFTQDGTAPLYQYAYGSYGASMDPHFRSSILSLVDRGFVFAIAHIRGGQEMGRKWYEDGKLLKKMNTFTDFIDVSRHLVQEKYAAKDKVTAVGGSAGGLLVGAVANLAPQDYRAMVAQVPFVDVVTTMLDESIPLTTNEFDEWGNPKQKEYYEYLLKYSPYDNLVAQDYPALLVTTGLWDSQVQYWEPAKWVAKMRTLKTDDAPLLFHVNMEAGHGGKSGRFRRQRETAMEFAFLLEQVQLTSAE